MTVPDFPLEMLLDLRAELAEGPVWDAAAGRLIFVDSERGRIFRFEPATRQLDYLEPGGVIGIAIPRSGGGYAASSADGLLDVDEKGRSRLLVPVERTLPGQRMNDAKCDSRGRLFSGTLSLPFAKGASALYRIDPDLSLHLVHAGVTVSNGIGWNPDETVMYYIDTYTRGIDCFRYDVDTGDIADRRRFADVDRLDGFPDGLCVDVEGGVWVALYMGGRIRRYAPDGTISAEVRLPVSGVTSCNFGGDGLTDLYITTARHGVPEDILRREPLAGALFRCRPDVPGLPSYRFAG